MQVWAVIAQKGGAGKTTVTLHVGIAAMQAGFDVEVIDLDPQQSAAKWGIARGKAPSFRAVVVPELVAAIADAKRRGIDLVILDTNGRADRDSLTIAHLADQIIIPVRPTILDLPAVEETIVMLKNAGVIGKSITVLNAVAQSTSEGNDAAGLLASMGPTLAPMRLGERVDYRRSLLDSKGVTEVRTGDKRAAGEVAGLTKWLIKHSGLVKLKVVSNDSKAKSARARG